MRAGYLLVAAPAAIATFLALWAYTTRGSGVSGTPGSLLALLGALAVTLDALLLTIGSIRGGARALLTGLLVLGLLLTGLAAYFLMQWWMLAALAVALVCIGFARLPHRRIA